MAADVERELKKGGVTECTAGSVGLEKEGVGIIKGGLKKDWVGIIEREREKVFRGW